MKVVKGVPVRPVDVGPATERAKLLEDRARFSAERAVLEGELGVLRLVDRAIRRAEIARKVARQDGTLVAVLQEQAERAVQTVRQEARTKAESDVLQALQDDGQSLLALQRDTAHRQSEVAALQSQVAALKHTIQMLLIENIQPKR
jgi:hypothetical protein